MNKPSFSVIWRKYKLLYIMLLPGLTAMFIFHYIPVYGIVIAFQDFKILRGVTGSDWVGLRNFTRLFSYIGVWKAVRNSFLISLYGLAAGFPLTILFALIINEIRQRHFKRVFQTISYLPHFLSWIIVSRFVMTVLSPSSGIVNQIIKSLGGNAVYFVAEPSWFRSILIISSLWKGIGWGSIIYLAAIANADVELYDAAYVDGAGRFRMAWHITIPAMYPVIAISLIMSISGLLGGSFEQIYNLMTSPTMEVGDVISTFVYRLGFGQMDYSASTATGLLQNLTAMALLIIANTVAKRFSEYTLW
jgi:putative aldouronate transport system permease protein